MEEKMSVQEGNQNTESNGGKLFTQDDVNRIVQERLSRVKADAASGAQTGDRERELDAREARLNCREYLTEKGHPAALLDVLDTTDFEKFKKAVETMQEKMPQAFGTAPQKAPLPTGARVSVGAPIHMSGQADPIAAAFKQDRVSDRD